MVCCDVSSPFHFCVYRESLATWRYGSSGARHLLCFVSEFCLSGNGLFCRNFCDDLLCPFCKSGRGQLAFLGDGSRAGGVLDLVLSLGTCADAARDCAGRSQVRGWAGDCFPCLGVDSARLACDVRRQRSGGAVGASSLKAPTSRKVREKWGTQSVTYQISVLSCSKSHLLPYRSSKTATVP
jgi:hypothetical protein